MPDVLVKKINMIDFILVFLDLNLFFKVFYNNSVSLKYTSKTSQK